MSGYLISKAPLCQMIGKARETGMDLFFSQSYFRWGKEGLSEIWRLECTQPLRENILGRRKSKSKGPEVRDK